MKVFLKSFHNIFPTTRYYVHNIPPKSGPSHQFYAVLQFWYPEAMIEISRPNLDMSLGSLGINGICLAKTMTAESNVASANRKDKQIIVMEGMWNSSAGDNSAGHKIHFAYTTLNIQVAQKNVYTL
jgi:hypothetical protein